MVNVWPTDGVNELISAAVSVPPRLAVPVILEFDCMSAHGRSADGDFQRASGKLRVSARDGEQAGLAAIADADRGAVSGIRV